MMTIGERDYHASCVVIPRFQVPTPRKKMEASKRALLTMMQTLTFDLFFCSTLLGRGGVVLVLCHSRADTRKKLTKVKPSVQMECSWIKHCPSDSWLFNVEKGNLILKKSECPLWKFFETFCQVWKNQIINVKSSQRSLLSDSLSLEYKEIHVFDDTAMEHHRL